MRGIRSVVAPLALRAGLVLSLAAGCSSPSAPPIVDTPRPFAPRSVVFIGDSFVERLGSLTTWYGIDAARWTNKGIGGEVSRQIFLRLATDDPKGTVASVVLLGINDIVEGAGTGGDHEDVTPDGPNPQNGSLGLNVQLIADSLTRQGTAPLLVTLFPICDQGQTYPASGTVAATNASIRKYDMWLMSFARQRGYAVLRLDSVFTYPDGTPRRALYGADCIHPSLDSGNAALTQASMPLLRRLGVIE